MRVVDMVSLADVFTLANALLGFSAIIAGIEGELELAYLLVVLGVLADGLDGMVARRFGTKWNTGDFLDIMADTVTFAVAPSVLMWLTYSEGLGDPDLGIPLLASRVLVYITGLLVITLGVLRLARFCFESGDQESDLYFTGLPIPAAALLIVTMLLMGWPGLIVCGLAIAVAILMVSDLKYPKARGRPGLVVGVLGLLMVITTLVGESLELVSEFMMYLTYTAVILYICLGPFAKGSKLEDVIEEVIE
jgi:CDP-diacylglycerol--serine O-phosphatidyltransferase